MDRSFDQEYFVFEQDDRWALTRRLILMSLLRKHLLTATFTAETPFVRSTGLPFGLSPICLARKREAATEAARAGAGLKEVA